MSAKHLTTEILNSLRIDQTIFSEIGSGSVWDDYISNSTAFDVHNHVFNITLYNCNVWSMPSRVVLQGFVLLMLCINLAAACIVFSVPISVRGKHVSFLFSCVRILNIFDIWQCIVIFFCPLFVTSNCHPSPAVCNFTGYLFAVGTLFSPIVAIVMAVDRAVAVYYHVWFKAHPYVKEKCLCLSIILGIYGFYFTLPFYTNFASYIAIPWLALCSFEWGIEHRSFNLILCIMTTLLMLVLLISNIAIILRIKKRKEQLKLLHGNYELRLKEEEKEKTKKSWLSRSIDNLANESNNVEGSSIKTHSPQKSSFQKRVFKNRPPPLKIRDCSNNNKATSAGDSTPSPSPLIRVNTTTSVRSPLSAVSVMSPSSSNLHPPSPLIHFGSEGEGVSPLIVKRNPGRPHSFGKSLDNIQFDNGNSNLFLPTFSVTKPQTPTLLRQVLGNPGKTSNRNSMVKSSDESESCQATPCSQHHSSASSFFTFPVQTTRGVSFRKKKKKRRVRKSASRITKMTTTICMVFFVLYLPFVVRKMIQLIPQNYNTVYIPPAIEIATLMMVLLSPLFNPIVYVFFNPHYRKDCLKKIKYIKEKCSCSTNCITNRTAVVQWNKGLHKSENHVTSRSHVMSRASSQNDDVFELDEKFVKTHNNSNEVSIQYPD